MFSEDVDWGYEERRGTTMSPRPVVSIIGQVLISCARIESEFISPPSEWEAWNFLRAPLIAWHVLLI